MKHKKAIGILGGMGPEASAYMYKTLIDLSIKHFGAKHNDDFPEIVLHSIPVPDFISSERDKERAMSMLKKRVIELNALQLSCLSLACNTAHVLLAQLQAVSKVPFISMIDAVAADVNAKKIKTVGLVGTPSTIRFGLYQTALKMYGIKTVIPREKQIVMLEKIIRNVIAGKHTKADEKNS